MAGGAKATSFDDEDAFGATISQKILDMPCNYFVGVSKSNDFAKTGVACKIDPNGSGSGLWNDLKENAVPTDGKSDDKNLKEGKDFAIAVSAQKILKPGESSEIEFALVWDMPKIKFLKSTRWFTRYYTKYFGDDLNAGEKILKYAFKNYPQWEQIIHEEWQKPILDDE